MKNLRIKHTFRRETYGKNIGKQNMLTVCQYDEENGQPMSASLHGHLHIEIARRQILGFRKVAALQPA